LVVLACAALMISCTAAPGAATNSPTPHPATTSSTATTSAAGDECRKVPDRRAEAVPDRGAPV